MITKPIYVPQGRAKEYADYACNIYTGCNNGCTYCFARKLNDRWKKGNFEDVKPRNEIVESVKRQLDKEKFTGRLIELCFTCDPYPHTVDTIPTREVIKAIKDSGNNVQILTKNGSLAERDFDLLTADDMFGVTYTGYEVGYLLNAPIYEPYADSPDKRLRAILHAKLHDIKTWLSCEPVLYDYDILSIIETADYIDLYKIGKLNYEKSDINWKEFGIEAERLCKEYNRNYYIKKDLREEMNKAVAT